MPTLRSPVDWYAFAHDVLMREPDRVVTRHRLDEQDPFFRDHFPGRPVLPGVLAIEAMLQAGRTLLAQHHEDGGRWVLASSRALRFSRFLSPGQWLVCQVRLLEDEPANATVAASCFALDASESGSEIDAGSELDAIDGLSTVVSGRLVLRPARLGGVV